MYDTLIIGIGCAGYTAAIYSARYKLSVYIIGADECGMCMSAAEVGNWPGDIDVAGPDLMDFFHDQRGTRIGQVEHGGGRPVRPSAR